MSCNAIPSSESVGMVKFVRIHPHGSSRVWRQRESSYICQGKVYIHCERVLYSPPHILSGSEQIWVYSERNLIGISDW